MLRPRKVETAIAMGFLVFCVVSAGQESAPPDPVDLFAESVVAGAGIGPDVIVSQLHSTPTNYGSQDLGGTGDYISAFSIGTDSCNVGDQNLDWYAGTNQHPAIHQSMYRLKNDRFEQLGMGWIKHGFYALNNAGCGLTCTVPVPEPEPRGTNLWVGCSDPYSASLNGSRSYLGPTWEINAHTGVFPMTHTLANGSGAIANRLQVHNYDLDPTLNAGAVYFVQGLYVHPDDAAAGNGNNNASYRLATIAPDPIVANKYNALLSGVTQQMQCAIRAWKDNDVSVVETEAQVAGEGLFILSAKVTDLGTGFFHYEYALQNLNSDRSGGSFLVPLPEGVFVENIGFHDVDYHDGDGPGGQNWDGTDWPATVEVGKITWATTPHSINPNANALRWSTLYNFRFDTNVGPDATTVTLGLFKPGFPSEVAIPTTGPRAGLIDCNENGAPDACDVDCDGLGCIPPCGGSLDCNSNSVPDECEADCNNNNTPDACDIRDGLSEDCNANTVPDECEADCDGDGIPDTCETITDTDGDGIDDCDDLCPETTPVNACFPPQFVTCCFSSGIYIPNFSRNTCLSLTGIPVCDNPPRCPGTPCPESSCRDGCLVGDFDRDGDLDMSDVGFLQSCYSGAVGNPAYVAPSAECLLRFDFDGDGDIDHGDYKEFLGTYTGP